MALEKTFSYADVSQHTSKNDLYLVIDEKVYNSSSFVDEHPGGEEVLLDLAGQDATEAFEDVGHSDEARTILDGLLVGKLERKEGDPPRKSATLSSSSTSTSNGGGLSVGLYAFVLIGGLAAYGAFYYLSSQSDSK